MGALVACGLLFVSAGCEDDDNDSSGGGGSSVSGTHWALYEGTSAAGAPTSWLHFQTDGTFYMSDDAEGNNHHLQGSAYSQSGSTVTGSFENPGVGEGEIVCTLNGDDTLQMDFIEHWHDPYKHMEKFGVKL